MASVVTTAPAEGAAEHPGHGSKPYRAYVLGMLFIIYMINLMDRGLSSLLQEPIKKEFGLSDFQLGLLGGPAFALFYTFMGLPIARWAERWNRVSIVALATATWSGMTMLFGAATSFPLLLVARLGVGVGEAGCVPPSQSIISDYFPTSRRAAAIAIYLASVPLGAVVANLIGGPLADHFGWRMAFIVLGFPGVLVALIFKLTVKEPPRMDAAAPAPNFGAALKEVSKKGAFWHIALAAGLTNFVGVGTGQYLASYLMRVHHLTLTDIGLVTGPTMGLFSSLSVFVVGKILDGMIAKDRAWLARWPGIGLCFTGPLAILAYMAPTPWIMIPVLMASQLCANMFLVSLYTTAQGVVSPRIRATSAALVMIVITLLGYGLGPPVIGALSDFMKAHVVEFGLSDAAHANQNGLRYAVMMGALVNFWAAAHFLIGSTKLKRDWVG